MWLYESAGPIGDDGELLIWLADSSYINGQSHRFRSNVAHWLAAAMPLPALQTAFARIDTRAFEERMARFLQHMRAERFQQGSGQVRSKHLRLSGFQCQPQPGEGYGRLMLRLIDFASRVTGWPYRSEQVRALSALKTHRRGTRERIDVRHVRREGLDHFLREHDVFSFVFQTSRTMNYTTGLAGRAT
jgi:hypothetical protein